VNQNVNQNVSQTGNQPQERYNNQVNNTDRPKTQHKKHYGNNFNNQKKFNNGPYDNSNSTSTYMKNPNQHFVNKFDNLNAYAQQMGGQYGYGGMTPNYQMYPQMQNEMMQPQYAMNYQNQMQNMNMPNQEEGVEQEPQTGEALEKVILDSL
jgi:hypothetical protein